MPIRRNQETGRVALPDVFDALERLPTRRSRALVLVRLLEGEVAGASSIEKLYAGLLLEELRERPALRSAIHP